jgi:hypothetical protein
MLEAMLLRLIMTVGARDAITFERFRQIELGMPQAQVIRLLGSKATFAPGQRPSFDDVRAGTAGPNIFYYAAYVWLGRSAEIYVMFDVAGNVSGKMWSPREVRPGDVNALSVKPAKKAHKRVEADPVTTRFNRTEERGQVRFSWCLIASGPGREVFEKPKNLT